MNKDVVYVEPDNDITDIITKIEGSAEKIVVLVPPKKASVFRSAVNIKLVARAGATAEKTVVLVTVDPSIIKLAAISKIPVTKDLKTPPSVPEILKDEDEANDSDEVDDVIVEEDETDGAESKAGAAAKKKGGKVDWIGEDDEEEGDEGEKKSRKKKANQGGFRGWIGAHKVPLIISAVAVVGAVGFGVWAFKFAPAVTVGIEIQTELKSFAESVKFTTNPAEEDAKNGVFFLQEKKIEQNQEIKIEASGKKNQGETASGTITVFYNFETPGTMPVGQGAVFTSDGKQFTVTQGTTLAFSLKDVMEESENKCLNEVEKDNYCQKSGTISVSAAEPGSQYNIGNSTDWSNDAGVGVISSSIGGGTDKEITIVEQIDVEKAKDQLKASNEAEDKKKLMTEVGEGMIAIDSSFAETTTAAEPSPAVGAEVPEGTNPVLKATTTARIFAIDKAKVEEFIKEKAQLPEEEKIYEFKDPFVENFLQTDSTYSGRLKTNYDIGPEVKESEAVERIRGRGLGDIQHDLKGINGVVNVTIKKSYPWVMKAPDDTNKITVNVEVREKGGESQK